MTTNPKRESRVTPTGQAMGRSSARLAALGQKRLADAGLTNLRLGGMRDEMCASCACREGTVPNGCLQTQLDLLKAASEGERFLCHAPKDGRMCAGYIGVRAELVANPLPPDAQALIARWEYTHD